MLGWINLSIESFVTDTFGADAWAAILASSGAHANWVSSCPYSDKITYDLVVTAAKHLGVPVDQALEAYGRYFIKHVQDNGYTKLLHVLGSNVAEFLQNLNNLHLHLSMGWPAMVAPAFRCEQVTPESLLLHYYSSRPGLWPIVVGVLKGMSKEYFGFEVGVELVESRVQGADHEVFRLTYPFQEMLRNYGAGGADPGVASYAMPPALFYRLFPFHLLLADNLTVLQAGPQLKRIAPSLAPGERFVRHFKVRHPYVALDYANLAANANTSFLLLAREAMLTLKGQMVPVTLPDEGGGAPRRALLFLGSPRCSNLQDMQAQNLYLSDIPLHDMSRDFILLAEQRQAEADLKDKFERLTVELKAANDKLARTTKWLEDEKARAEALLYRMSGLLAACFPADGRNPSGSHAIDVAAAAAAAGGGLAGVAGAALVGSLNAGPMGVAGSVQLHASDDSGPPDHSMAAVAALLRQAGVRAPTVYGDSTMMPAGGTGYPGSEADVSVHGRSRKASAIDRIEAVRRELTKANINVGDTDNISCCELLGEGTYGKVYKGLWKGSVVAVKTIVLPALMSGAEKREKMAIMEAAISSALSHPNIVQTYTYSIRQLRDTSAAASRLVMGIPHAGGFDNSEGNGGPGGVHSFEVQLVLEYCDRGSLRDALDRGAFRGAFAPHSTSTASDASGSSHGRAGTGAAAAAGSGAGGDGTVGPASFSGPLSSSSGAADVNYRAVLDTALDVATAMVHLHGRNVLHADLKARNIMLKSNGAEGRGVSAKVADFGLSVKMDHMETHLSNTFQGTLSHMSPELLMKGYLSKASDVYAFGILLWELYTGGHPFRTVPKALLGHQITKLHKRPEFPTGTPAGFMALAARCWDPKPSRRPTMDEVLAELKYLRRDEPAATPPLAAYELPFASAVDSHGNALPSGASGTATAGVRGGGGGAIAAMERSVYIEHSYSTLHEGTFEGCDGTSGPSQGGDRACSSGSGDDSSSGGSRGGSPDGRHASQAARCPLHHGSH